MDIAINYYAVIAATVVAMIVGTLWYGPLFGNAWKRMMGFTDESMKAMKMSPVGAVVGMLVLSLLLNYVLAHVIQLSGSHFGSVDVMRGITTAFWLWLGFAVPFTAGSYLWEGKSWKLWAFNALYYLVTFVAAGAILGGWV